MYLGKLIILNLNLPVAPLSSHLLHHCHWLYLYGCTYPDIAAIVSSHMAGYDFETAQQDILYNVIMSTQYYYYVEILL